MIRYLRFCLHSPKAISVLQLEEGACAVKTYEDFLPSVA